jgi:uncharacterized protein
MRKTEREIKDRAEIDAIIRGSQAGRLGLTNGIEPYIVPLCFGYDGDHLYFHCAQEGRKMDILRKNNRVCFEFDHIDGFVENEQACQWGLRYRSVIGFGTATILEDPEEKRQALTLVMKQYSPSAYTFPEKVVSLTAVIKIRIESISGKHGRLP